MLAVFIDELGPVFAPYAEQASRILIHMIDYEANVSIRNSVASALPGLIKCIKNADPTNSTAIINYSRLFIENLVKAINIETETDTLISQVQALKDIIDEVGDVILEQPTVDALGKLLLDQYAKSDDRIKKNNELAKNSETVDEDDQIDKDEMEVIKEENNNEYDLQLSIAEIIGIMFKTHGTLCGGLISELFNVTLPHAFAQNEKQKTKFGLFILDDMVEFLGPNLLGANYVHVAKQIIKHCHSPVSAVRQAASYGIGIMAEKSGAAFAAVSNDALLGLKYAIEFQMP
jgi:hypothetical protein